MIQAIIEVLWLGYSVTDKQFDEAVFRAKAEQPPGIFLT